jgi:DNA-binding CsgD family transcriptional regulator
MWEEGYGRATEVLEAALAEDAGDLELEVVVRTDLSLTLLQSGAPRSGAEQGRRAIELALMLGLEELARTAFVHTATAEFLLGEGSETDPLERAEAAEGQPQGAAWSTIVHSQLFASLLLKWTDDFNTARSGLETLYQEVLARHDETAVPSIAFQLGQLECWLGDFERAERYAQAGRTAALEAGHAAEEVSPMYLDALVAAHIGRIDEARSAATEALEMAERAQDILFVVRSLALLGFIELSLGRTDAAAPYLRRASQMSRDADYGEPNVLRFHADAAETLIAVGALDEAEALLGWLDERGHSLGRAWALATAARGRAQLAAAGGDLDRAAEAVNEALGHHERLQQPFEFARTLLVQGSVQRRRRERRLAHDTLRRAIEIFDGLGTPLWAEKARSELGRIGGRTASRDELTPTEQRIAALVASGKTNKEVAAELFVTVHTVEAALTRIYGKLHVRSRTELATRIN